MRDLAPPTALSCHAHAFFFDFDGTLVDIEARPELVRAEPGMVGDLSALLARAAGAVAVVTGRQLSTVDEALAPLRLPGAGVHGLELRMTGKEPVRPPAGAGPLAPLRAQAEAWVARKQGLQLEDKGLSLAIHYRACPDMGPAVTAYVEGLAQRHPGLLTVQHGKMVAELRRSGPGKGDAVRLLLRGPAFASRTPVYFGDDVTDEAAFAAVQEAGGVGVFIGPETARTQAMARLRTPAEVRHIISTLARDGEAQLDALAPAEAGATP
jgi:trehalose 6-phosphate phosphatase